MTSYPGPQVVCGGTRAYQCLDAQTDNCERKPNAAHVEQCNAHSFEAHWLGRNWVLHIRFL
jgi:hypothetical protein